MAKLNPSYRHKKYIGIIGDVNPIEHSGGIVVDEGYGPHMIYFQPYETEGEDMVSVYNFPIKANVLEDLNWAGWDEIASYIGIDVDELKGYATSDNVFERADVYASVGSYAGYVNLDSDPQEMTFKQAEGTYGRAVAAAHRAQSKAREKAHAKARVGNPRRKPKKHVSNVRKLISQALK